MPLVSFHELMADAERHGYAVGYFESWDLASLLAVADAAEAASSPVILGFSGIYLPHAERIVGEPLEACAAMATAVGQRLKAPCCLLFNESPRLDWVRHALKLGFQLVMYTPESEDAAEQVRAVHGLVDEAHARAAAVEGEIAPPAGLAGDLSHATASAATEPEAARRFVGQTGCDALAVNVGQVHLHGRQVVRLDLERLAELRDAAGVPLVLHGASSVAPEDLAAAIRFGVRKINVGSALKQAFFAALCAACDAGRYHKNPYEVIGSGLAADVLVAGRLAMQAKVQEFMHCFGSAGRAGGRT